MSDKDLAFMKRYSIFHAILTVLVLVVTCLISQNLFITLVLYALFLLFLPVLARLISEIGWHEVGPASFGVGENTHVETESHLEFYGPLSVLRDYLFYIVGCSIPLTIVYFVLPETIFLPIFATALIFVIFHFIVHPLIKDLVWIFARKDPSALISGLYITFTCLIIVAGIVGTAAFAAISAKKSKENLDVNALLEQHFENLQQRNPYMDMDMNEAEVDFSKLSTRATLIFNEPIVSDSGISYPGSEMKLSYIVNTGEWMIISHNFTGEPDIVSTVVYVGENQLEIGGYSGLAQVEVTVFSKTADGGSGVIKIIDKATSAEVYASPFTFDGHVDVWGNVTFKFENPLNLGPWEVSEEEFKWEAIDHLYFYMNTRDFNLYMQE